jgi:hypothetical protein
MKQAMIPDSVRKLRAIAAVAATVFAVSLFAQSKNTGKPQLSIRESCLKKKPLSVRRVHQVL